MKKIILKGNNEDILSITLYDILIQITDIESYQWKLIWLEGSAPALNMKELEYAVNRSVNGFLIDGRELVRISQLFEQLIDVIVIGDKNRNNLQKSDNDDEMKARCEFFIELVDSSYWEIATTNACFIKVHG